MPLTDQEKNALKEQVGTLLEMNEPEAILGTLKRVAERMAHSVTRGKITAFEAQRWQSLAKACADVEAQLERDNAPQTRNELPSADRCDGGHAQQQGADVPRVSSAPDPNPPVAA